MSKVFINEYRPPSFVSEETWILAEKDGALCLCVCVSGSLIYNLGTLLGPDVEYEDEADTPILREAVKQLDEYFYGRRKTFTVPVKPATGTEFRRTVWQKLTEIPYGETISYSELALRLGKPSAVRAAASAVALNPLLIFIPCHRVIAKSGAIGDYIAGTECKKTLLETERLFKKSNESLFSH